MSIFDNRRERLAVLATMLILAVGGITYKYLTQTNKKNRTPPLIETTDTKNQQHRNDAPKCIVVYHQYKVVKGDTLTKIARKQGISLESVILYNPQIKNSNLIREGESITIPLILTDEAKSLEGRIANDTPKDSNDNQSYTTEIIDFIKNKQERTSYVDYIIRNSQEKGLRNVIVSLIESSIRQFDDNYELVKSQDGAVGMFQLTPAGIRYLNQCTGKKADRKVIGKKGERPIYEGVLEGTYSWSKVCEDPISNMQAGIDYLKILDKLFNNYTPQFRDELVLAAYNCGFPTVKEAVRKARKAGLENPENIETYRLFLPSRAQEETGPYVDKYKDHMLRYSFGSIPVIH